MDVLTSLSLKQAPALTHHLAFERKHVRSSFETSPGAPVVLLHAPAGYGKTTALSFFAEQEGPSARWITLDESDRSLSSMIVTLVSAIYGWQISEPAPLPDVREAAKLIVGAIDELAITTIIFDNYETVASSDDVNELIEAVTERLPARVRFLIASEVSPPFVKRARLRQSIVELGTSDLVFDADDVSVFLREIHNYVVADKFASSIARRTRGCAAVVNLVGQLVHNLPRYLRVDFEALPLGPTEEHMTLLLREVLARAGYPPAHAARDLAVAGAGALDGSLPRDTLLDLLGSRSCLAHVYATEPRKVVPHRLLLEIAPKL
jgi:ATP/maltotriose-dependent transcriptional regulator MalT